MAAEQKAVESTVKEETDLVTAKGDHSVTDRADRPAAATEGHSEQVKEEVSATESLSMAKEEASGHLTTMEKEDLSETGSSLTAKEGHSATAREDSSEPVREDHSAKAAKEDLTATAREGHSAATARESRSVTDRADHSVKAAKEEASAEESLSEQERMTTGAESHSEEAVTSTISVTRRRAESTR